MGLFWEISLINISSNARLVIGAGKQNMACGEQKEHGTGEHDERMV